MSSTRLLLSLRGARAFRRTFASSVIRSQDPWPVLPSTPAHEESTRTSPNLPPPPRIERPGEELETMRARLVYQSRKRGTLETDLVLSTFAKENLGRMGKEEMEEFDRLLDENDWDIYYWATEKRPPPERWQKSQLLERLQKHARNEDKVVRRMPEL